MGISTNQQRITFFAGYLADWQCITRTHCDHCFDCWEKRWVGLLLRMTNNSNHWRSLGNRGSVRAAPLLGVPNWVQQGGLHLPVIKWAAAVSSIFLETGFQAAILAQSWLAIWMDIELLRPVDFGHSNRSTDDPTFGLPNCDPSTQKNQLGNHFSNPGHPSSCPSRRYCFCPMAIFVLRLGSTAGLLRLEWGGTKCTRHARE